MDIPIISPIFGFIIRFLNGFGFNYLVTLFLFALIVKLALLPLGVKQQKTQIKQAKIRPKEMAIRKKYAGRNDQKTQQKLNEEIMRLYQEENVNPMSGCLPMLLQMPIIFALYGVITKPLTYISVLGKEGAKLLTTAYNAVAEQAATGYAEISILQKITENGDFASKVGEKFTELVTASNLNYNWAEILPGLDKLHDSFTVFGIDLTVNPSFKLNVYILIPILTFVFSFFSTKVIRKFTYQPTTNADPSTQASLTMMDWMMPLLSVWISFSVSSAIAVYWIFQNILSAGQQILLYKLYPIPVVTEEEIRAAELEIKGKSSRKREYVGEYEIDDYDKTVVSDKSGSKKASNSVFGSRKAGISPKVKEIIKKNGRPLKARRKI